MTWRAAQLFPWMVGCAFGGIAIVAADNYVASQRAADLCDELPRGTREEKIRVVAGGLHLRRGMSQIYGLDDAYRVAAVPRQTGKPFQSTLVVTFRGFLSAKKICSILIRDGKVINNYRG